MVGRLGELAVEQELLKRGWMVGNFNASLPNLMAYDLFAVKGARRICLRVKATSGNAIQYTARQDGTIFRSLISGDDGDFVAIVLMEGSKPKEFYIVPTRIVKEKLITANRAWHRQTKRDGTPRKKTTHRALEFSGKATAAPHRGMRLKWSRYRDAWGSLE
ncbi:MAG: hypothetical protein DYH13_04105 [Alphaproteobacteria bacterium PRO2]|nr:hypothetical protein [Alphaproteobacteria bacterium PRO2]